MRPRVGCEGIAWMLRSDDTELADVGEQGRRKWKKLGIVPLAV